MYTECLWNLQNLLETIRDFSKVNVEKPTVFYMLTMNNYKVKLKSNTIYNIKMQRI